MRLVYVVITFFLLFMTSAQCQQTAGHVSHSELLQVFGKAIEINPQDADAWYNKGVALYNLGRYEEAIKAYDEAIKLNPQDTDAWYNPNLPDQIGA